LRISKRSGGIIDAKPETKLLFHTMVKNTFRLSFLLGLPWFVGNYAKFESINIYFEFLMDFYYHYSCLG